LFKPLANLAQTSASIFQALSAPEKLVVAGDQPSNCALHPTIEP